MRKLIMLWIGLLLIVAAPGCGKRRHEAVMEDGVKTLEELAEVLSGLETADDVAANEGKLNELAKKSEKLRKESNALDDSPEGVNEKLTAEYKERLKRVKERLAGIKDSMSQEVRDALLARQLDRFISP